MDKIHFLAGLTVGLTVSAAMWGLAAFLGSRRVDKKTIKEPGYQYHTDSLETEIWARYLERGGED